MILPLPLLLEDRSATLQPEAPEFEPLALADMGLIAPDEAAMGAVLASIAEEIATGAAEIPGAQLLLDDANAAFGASPGPALQTQAAEVEAGALGGDGNLAEFDAVAAIGPPVLLAAPSGGGIGTGTPPTGGGGSGGGTGGGTGGGGGVIPLCDPDLIARQVPCDDIAPKVA